ncbi:MAG: hypothetical protein CEE38_21915, partial [Planctomycetes bacterium B3_Pla]
THAKVIAPEVPADTGGETIADTSPVVGTPTAPAPDMNSPMPENPIDDGGKATDATDSANTADARITAVQTGPSETQPELVAIDPDKSLQAAGKEPTVAETSPVAGTPAAPAANIKSPMLETPVEDGGKATEAPQNTQNSPRSNGQGPGFNAAQQPDIVQAWRAMNSVPVEQSRDGAATRIEPKAGRQLAELIAAAKAEKSLPAAGRTAQSVEIKPLPTTDKGPLGLNSVSPETIRHTPAATIQPVEAATDGTISSSNEAVIDTETATQQGTHAKVIAPEVPADTGGETIADTSPVVGTPTAPAPDMNSPMPETPVDDGGKATDAPQNTQNSPRLKGQGPGFNAAQQPDIVQAWRAQNSAPVEQSRDGAATRIEPKAGRQLAELIAAAKAEKSPPAIGRTAQSVEIKPLPTTDKGPLGLNSVSPETIRHTPAVTIQPAEAATDGTVSSSNEAVIDTETATQQGTHVKVLSPEVPADTVGETIAAAKEPTVAVTPIVPASNIKSPMPESPVDDGGKATDAAGSTNTVDAPIKAVQAGPSETQPELVAIDPDKSLQASLKTSNPAGEKFPQVENDLLNTHSVPKPNTKDVQAPTDQTQSRGSSGSSSNNGLYPDSEQILSQNSNHVSFAEQLPTAQESAGTDNPPRPASTGDVAADVGKQILESVQSSISSQTADRQITIQLNPPELGKVFIKFQEQDAQISGTLEVSKAQTRSEIEQALPQIIQNLTNSGIQIKRLEVVLSQEDQSTQQAFKDPLQQDGSSGQHNPADSDPSGNGRETATGTYYGPTNDTGYQSAAELQEMPARDDSINFLV